MGGRTGDNGGSRERRLRRRHDRLVSVAMDRRYAHVDRGGSKGLGGGGNTLNGRR